MGKDRIKLILYKLKLILSKLNPLRITIDIRFFLFFGGLVILWHGLNLFLPWLSYTVIGIILMLLGWLLQDVKGGK